ncbi:putative Anti-anti-sigma regulatory factor (antagonist of anti-sigma factor) [Vibrio nigripulchritudo MADA3029]|uniref:Anti-sigma factor antagonist n=2 Tax=Vibrio nigripulchritudo TaxID=28173 RepID=U4KAV3_9VIBR|nr:MULTISPECIES: STAS domain-containing protein [Vibrio]EGU57506.1 anti-anti-sigma regulatory factor (antagonist of anti-sigma factor) [Vibrio nigripulchritudo ATCC 27043]KJY79634.1 anti-anti-sigma regulatory factor [Vibrio nigripulchritudo]UAB73279.1 STAS domain-containing protein [Vibrio sp. SCSIO 43132]CCN36637.1 putative Anti-anti-sigma regulatory factor (antagonist of anti-sigma factor) [Vibrio nigripulchritudo AM115]CCN43817.1 putative Anti-anti-sigma regulatory factor (antagonist of ant
MSVTAEIDNNQRRVVISVEGAFGFNLVHEFRQSYCEQKGYRFVVDFRKVDYIDSAGLGMLLNMHKYLNQKDGEIVITNSMPQVKKILLISRFDKKFSIE